MAPSRTEGAILSGFRWSENRHARHRISSEEPPQWIQGTLPNVIGAALIVPLAWLIASSFGRRRRLRGRAPAPKGNRLAVYIASFGDDHRSRTAQRSVVDSIYEELGEHQVEVLPADIELEDADGIAFDAAIDRATARAQDLLQRNRAQALIWGRLHEIGSRGVIELRFVPATLNGSPGLRIGFTERLLLEAPFPAVLAGLLATTACLVVEEAEGNSDVSTLVGVAARLEPLVVSFPESMDNYCQGAVLQAFGRVQCEIGERTDDTLRLEAAVDALSRSVDRWNRQREPMEWASTQCLLGMALGALGNDDIGPERLREAAAACRLAVEQFSKADAPQAWAHAHLQLGTVLTRLGKHQGDADVLREADVHLLEVLTVNSRRDSPVNWGIVQANRCTLLAYLGSLDDGSKYDEALVVGREAVRVLRRRIDGQVIATAQINVAAALAGMARRDQSVSRYKQSASAYRRALRRLKRETKLWFRAMNGLAASLFEYGAITRRRRALAESAAIATQVLSIVTRDSAYVLWSQATNVLGSCLYAIGMLDNDADTLRESVRVCSAAVDDTLLTQSAHAWAMAQINLGNALSGLGELTGDHSQLQAAIDAYRKAEARPELGEYWRGVARLNMEKTVEYELSLT